LDQPRLVSVDSDFTRARIAADMNKPTAVIDKSLLEPICFFPDEIRSRCLQFLREHFTIYAPKILIEEVLNNYYVPNSKDRKNVAAKMLLAIRDFHWMEHPLELVYREAVLGKDVKTGFDLSPEWTANWRYWLSNLDTCAAEAKEFDKKRLAEKEQYADVMKNLQNRLKDLAKPESPNHTCLVDFVQKTETFLKIILIKPEFRNPFLREEFVAPFKRRHPETAQRTEEAFGKLGIDNLSGKPFTHDYAMAFLLYLWAPVVRIGPHASKPSNPLVLTGSLLNHWADREYVVSALLCDYLFTCDKGMHKMAQLHNSSCCFKHTGRSQRQVVLISRPPPSPADAQVENLLNLLGTLV